MPANAAERGVLTAGELDAVVTMSLFGRRHAECVSRRMTDDSWRHLTAGPLSLVALPSVHVGAALGRVTQLAIIRRRTPSGVNEKCCS